MCVCVVSYYLLTRWKQSKTSNHQLAINLLRLLYYKVILEDMAAYPSVFFNVALRVGRIMKTMLTPLPSSSLLLLLLPTECVHGPKPYTQISTASTGVRSTVVVGDAAMEVSHAAVVEADFESVQSRKTRTRTKEVRRKVR